jgi:hypothetical protein
MRLPNENKILKVKDLIAELQQADPEAELIFEMADGCCADTEFLTLYDASEDKCLRYNLKSELVPSKDFPNGQFRFFFDAPWFLETCRKAGAAKRAAKEVQDAHDKWLEEQRMKK